MPPYASRDLTAGPVWVEKNGWHRHFDGGKHTFGVLLWLNP